MAKIIWEGNQEWGKAFPDKPIPTGAVKIKRPDNVLRASLPYGIISAIICFLAIFIKTYINAEVLFDLRFIPVGFIIGFVFALPAHEFLHAVCYTKDAVVYVGVCIKKVAAYAVSSYPMSKCRYIVMSLAPALLGIIPLAVFLICPCSCKALQTICIVPSFMGLISLSPDYMDVIQIMRQVPAGAKIHDSNEGLFWYQ